MPRNVYSLLILSCVSSASACSHHSAVRFRDPKSVRVEVLDSAKRYRPVFTTPEQTLVASDGVRFVREKGRVVARGWLPETVLLDERGVHQGSTSATAIQLREDGTTTFPFSVVTRHTTDTLSEVTTTTWIFGRLVTPVANIDQIVWRKPPNTALMATLITLGTLGLIAGPTGLAAAGQDIYFDGVGIPVAILAGGVASMIAALLVYIYRPTETIADVRAFKGRAP